MLVNNCGTIAITTKVVMTTAEIQKIGLRRRSRQASPRRDRGVEASSSGRGSNTTSTLEFSVMRNPWVQEAVHEVHDEVGE